MRPTHRIDLRRRDPVRSWTREWSIRGDHGGGAPRIVLLITAFLAFGAASAAGKSDGGYTTAQAARGATVYARSCLQCNGGNLQGESGPPLSGQTLRSAYGGG